MLEGSPLFQDLLHQLNKKRAAERIGAHVLIVDRAPSQLLHRRAEDFRPVTKAAAVARAHVLLETERHRIRTEIIDR